MRSLFRLGLFLLLVCVCAPVYAQRIPVYAINLKDSLNNPLTTQICWQPVGPPDPISGRAGAPISFADGSGDGYTSSLKVCYAVSAGAFGPLSLPDTNFTSVKNACFHVTAQDPNSNTLIIDDACVQPSSAAFAKYWCPSTAAGCDFDKFHNPFVPNVREATAGPPGPQGVGIQGLPGNAGTLATPAVAGVVYTPAGSTTDTLSNVALGGMTTQILGPLASSGTPHGAHAHSSLSEFFAPDGHCGTGTVTGWDYTSGTTCSAGHFSPNSTTMWLNHAFWYGSMGSVPASPTHAAITFNTYNATPNYWQVGFNSCAIGTYGGSAGSGSPGTSNCAAADRWYMWGTGTSFGVTFAGTITTLWPQSSPTLGETDSGFGAAWAGPASGNFSDNTLSLLGDGTAMISVVPWGGTLTFSGYTAASFHVALTPPTGLHQVEATGYSTGTDYLANIAATDGLAPIQGAPAMDAPNNPEQHTGKFWRWAFHANGTESTYNGDCASSTDCMTVWAVLPPDYDPAKANPWVVQIHGQESAVVSAFSDYEQGSDKVLDTLYQAGMVIVFLDFHTTVSSCGDCIYGGAQNMADIAMALKKVRSALNLAGSPYAMADSGGGIVLMDAVTHGVILPKAMLCFSCNLSLYADYTGNGMQVQAGNIQNAYGFAVDAQYATATAGFDPVAVVQNPASAQATLGGTNGLVANAASVLAAIPTYLAGDNADSTVNTAADTVAYFNAIAAINPGVHQVQIYSGSAHVGADEMLGSVVLNWIQSHP